VGPAGRVVAFEPQRLVFQALCATLALNSLTNVDAYWAAVGAAPGMTRAPELDFTVENNFGGVALGAGAPGSPVPLVALDGFAPPRVRLIKIDVEGMELEVLQGARRLLERLQPRLYVENDRPERSEPLMRFLLGLGYRLFWHCPPLFNPGNFYGARENVFGAVASLNLVCLPREDGLALPDLAEARDPAAHPLAR
jgi:FkbM family methyltransferase